MKCKLQRPVHVEDPIFVIMPLLYKTSFVGNFSSNNLHPNILTFDGTLFNQRSLNTCTGCGPINGELREEINAEYTDFTVKTSAVCAVHQYRSASFLIGRALSNIARRSTAKSSSSLDNSDCQVSFQLQELQTQDPITDIHPSGCWVFENNDGKRSRKLDTPHHTIFLSKRKYHYHCLEYYRYFYRTNPLPPNFLTLVQYVNFGWRSDLISPTLVRYVDFSRFVC
jgi:hypothetical protein